jgi:hypothetical protein
MRCSPYHHLPLTALSSFGHLSPEGRGISALSSPRLRGEGRVRGKMRSRTEAKIRCGAKRFIGVALPLTALSLFGHLSPEGRGCGHILRLRRMKRGLPASFLSPFTGRGISALSSPRLRGEGRVRGRIKRNTTLDIVLYAAQCTAIYFAIRFFVRKTHYWGMPCLLSKTIMCYQSLNYGNVSRAESSCDEANYQTHQKSHNHWHC